MRMSTDENEHWSSILVDMYTCTIILLFRDVFASSENDTCFSWGEMFWGGMFCSLSAKLWPSRKLLARKSNGLHEKPSTSQDATPPIYQRWAHTFFDYAIDLDDQLDHSRLVKQNWRTVLVEEKLLIKRNSSILEVKTGGQGERGRGDRGRVRLKTILT